MKYSYVKDLNYQYLVITAEQEQTDNYQLSMLWHNNISGCLQMHVQHVDKELQLCYDITGFEPLSTVYESRKITRQEIISLFLHFSHAVLEVKKYLINGEYFELQPEYIYVSEYSGDICFCCNPYSEISFQEKIRGLCRFIIDNIDYSDRNSIQLAYALFQESLKDNVSIAAITRCLNAALEGDESKPEDIEEAENIRESEMHQEEEKTIRAEANVKRRPEVMKILVCLFIFFVLIYSEIVLCGKLKLIKNAAQLITVLAVCTLINVMIIVFSSKI